MLPFKGDPPAPLNRDPVVERYSEGLSEEG